MIKNQFIKEKVKVHLIRNTMKGISLSFKFNEKKSSQSFRFKKNVIRKLDLAFKTAKFPLNINPIENKNEIRKVAKQKKPNFLILNGFIFKKMTKLTTFDYLSLNIISKFNLLTSKPEIND